MPKKQSRSKSKVPEKIAPEEKRPRSKPEKDTPEIKIGKSGLVAGWISAVAGVIALVFVGYEIYFSLQPKPITDTFTVSKVELILNGPTGIKEVYNLSGDKTGIISVFWKIMLTNLGEKDLSVIKCNVIDKSDELRRGETYTGLDQGLFSCDGEYSPFHLPINIPDGGAVSVCLKIGFVMDKDIYELVRQNFTDKPTTFGEIESFLRLQSTDIYANKIKVTTMSDGKHSFAYPAIENIDEQLFLVNFTSARGGTVHRLIGYQICNGLVESALPVSCLLNDDLKSFTTPLP